MLYFFAQAHILGLETMNTIKDLKQFSNSIVFCWLGSYCKPYFAKAGCYPKTYVSMLNLGKGVSNDTFCRGSSIWD